eukprot:s92_g25.t1
MGLLLEAACDIESQATEDGSTALQWPSAGGYLEAVQLLLEAGSEVNSMNMDGDAALHYASVRGHLKAGHVRFLDFLLEAGAGIERRDAEDGSTAMHWALAGGRLEAVRLLLEAGAEARSRSTDDATSLHYAAAGGHWKLRVQS